MKENNISESELKTATSDYSTEEKTVEQLEHHIEDLSDKLLRCMAESENVRRRYEKQIEEIKDYAVVNFAKDLISVVDNLERAIKFQPENASAELKGVIEGVVMTHKELISTLSKHGVIAIEPQAGEKFDYNMHYAITNIVSEDFPPESIVGLMQVGYKIKDRLLRPAAVSVAKAKEE